MTGSSPARLGDAGQITAQREVAQRDAAQTELAIHGLAAAGEHAATRLASRAGVSRQAAERNADLLFFLGRELRVLQLAAQLGAALGVLFDQLVAILIA